MLRQSLCIVFLFVSSYVFAMGGVPTEHALKSALSKRAVEFTLPKASGVTQSFAEVHAGRKSILFFWATWCPHCHEELLNLKNQSERLKAGGINVILVNFGERKEDVIAFLNNQEMPFDSFLDIDSTLQEPYDIIGLPTFYFIDEKGIVRNMQHSLPEHVEDYFTSN